MVFIRSGRSRPPLPKQPPPKKCREASTTVVLKQEGFDEVVSSVRWTISDILTYRRCRKLKKKKVKDVMMANNINKKGPRLSKLGIVFAPGPPPP